MDIVGEGKDAITPRHFLGKELDGFAFHDDIGEIRALLTERAAHDIANDGLGGETETD